MAVCVIASAGLATVYSLTAERIKNNVKQELQEKLKSVIPDADRFEEKGTEYIGYKDNKKVGVAVRVSPNGYGGPINMLMGVDRNGKILGIAILSHKETPGLGKKIEDQQFRSQFKGKRVEGLILKKDSAEGMIDAITAATISSRAVTDALRETYEEWKRGAVDATSSATPKRSVRKASKEKP